MGRSGGRALTYLVLAGNIGDRGLEHLRDMSDLVWLEGNDTQVGNAGLAHLQGLSRRV